MYNICNQNLESNVAPVVIRTLFSVSPPTPVLLLLNYTVIRRTQSPLS